MSSTQPRTPMRTWDVLDTTRRSSDDSAAAPPQRAAGRSRQTTPPTPEKIVSGGKQPEGVDPNSSKYYSLNSQNKYLDGLFTTATPALASGAIQAVIFNPFDRALYVRVHHQRDRFLDRRNFERPFQGFGNAAIYRTICSASYIFWQDSAKFFINEWAPSYNREECPVLNPVLIGLFAGVANGALLNNMQAIKFTMWKRDDNNGFFHTAKSMYQFGGWRIFFGGIKVTIARDAVFGLFYETIRTSDRLTRLSRVLEHNATSLYVSLCYTLNPQGTAPISMKAAKPKKLEKVDQMSLENNDFRALQKNYDSPSKKGGAMHKIADDAADHKQVSKMSRDRENSQFILNLFAALIACIASAPLNYSRTVIYGTLEEKRRWLKPRTIMQPISMLWQEFKNILTSNDSNKKVSPDEWMKQQLHSTGGTRVNPLQYSLGAGSQRVQYHWMPAFRHVNSRLNIGWGSVRVGVGMSVGQQIFAFVKDAMEA